VYYLPYYWLTDSEAGSPYAVMGVRMAALDLTADRGWVRHDDPHLRSAHAVTHHYVHEDRQERLVDGYHGLCLQS
jgi:hypothetical protein